MLKPTQTGWSEGAVVLQDTSYFNMRTYIMTDFLETGVRVEATS